MHIPEELLHFIWRFRLLDHINLKTIEGAPVKIIRTGLLNTDEGPDFSYAKLRIGQTEWVGDVEIHVHEKDWFHHTHHLDENYNKVILHVVWQRGNRREFRADQSPLTTLEMCHFVDEKLLLNYQNLMSNLKWIPCAEYLPKVQGVEKMNVLSRMAIERLEFRYSLLLNKLDIYGNDWEKVFRVLLCRAFGMKVNADAFEKLAEILPWEFLLRKRGNALTISAILFGQAGFLEQEHFEDVYFMSLKREFEALEKGMHLERMSPTEWKFLRMRPYNFPTFRLAQLATLLCQSPLKLSTLVEMRDFEALSATLKKLEIDHYWHSHFRFGVESTAGNKKIAAGFVNHLIINVFSLIKFSYGKHYKQDRHCEEALQSLEYLKAENNKITRGFSELGMPPKNVLDSQALLHLHKEYCEKKRCLSCHISYAVLNR